MPMPISMFDCPEHNHTSPTITSSNWTLLEPVTVKRIGPTRLHGWQDGLPLAALIGLDLLAC